MCTINIVLFKNTFFFSPLCGNQYTDKKSLQKHQRIHHPEAWAQRPKGRPKRWKPVRNISFLNLLPLQIQLSIIWYTCEYRSQIYYFPLKRYRKIWFYCGSSCGVRYVLPNLDWIASRDLSIFSVQVYPQIANFGHKILSCLTECKGLHNSPLLFQRI